MVLWGCPPPRGYLSVSSVSPEEHGIEGPVPQPPGGPLVGPAQPPVHLPHQGEGLFPQRVRDRAPVPVPWPAPLCPPRRLPSLPLCLRRRCRAPPPLRRGHSRQLRPRRGWGWLVRGRGSWGGRARRRQGRCCRGGDDGGGGGGGCGAPASVGCRGGCTSPAARPAAGAPRSPPPCLCPALPPGLPCPILPVPWGPQRPCPCPWAPFQPPARAAGPAPRPPRPGPPAHPPPLALPPAPGLPVRAPARTSRALVPSRPPALSRAVRCLRSAPPRCCALAPCRACPCLLLARAPGHFPCRLLPPATRSRGWHAALPARPPLLPGLRAGRPAVFAAAAA